MRYNANRFKEVIMNKAKLIRISFFSILIFFLCLPVFSKKIVIDSTWASSPLQIDGAMNDWAADTLTYYKKVKVDYAFKNDADYLYIVFRFNDPEYVSSVTATGMTVYYNLEGKKKKHYGINFKGKQVAADTYINVLEKSGQVLTEEQKKTLRAQRFIVLNDNTVINNKSKSLDAEVKEGTIPAVFKSQKGKDAFIYEFAIPLKKEAEMAPGIGTDPGKQIMIGFEWGGMTKEMKEQRLKKAAAQGSQGRARSGSQSGITSERGGGGGLSGSLSSIRRYGPKEHDFWVDVQLSVKK
jgi:hypothetical protein